MEIKIEGMGFSYGSANVLDDINLEIKGSQLVSIIGPNGVGKSTLIHCINKILTPTEGTVYLDGRDVMECTIKDTAQIIGYVPYKASDSFPLTVVDTVLLGRHPHVKYKTTRADLEIVYDVLRKLDIEDLAMRYFNELSAGQHQKVMLARGLVQEPKVLLLDEPTSNLDIKHQMGITRLMMNLAHEDDILVIMISHDLNLAAKFSDYVILMYEGKIYDVGTPEQVITEENIRVVYGVNARIMTDQGRPHVIIEDEQLDVNVPMNPESSCVTSKPYKMSRCGPC